MAEPALQVTTDRVGRAIAAFVRQEFEAPVAAILGFLEILLEDARRHGPGGFVPDLERMRVAGAQLRELVSELLDTAAGGGRLVAPADSGSLGARLRHDLRTPLNAIKGYGEMLVEEAHESGCEAFLHDLAKVLDSADRLLGQIDGMVESIRADADGGSGPATSSTGTPLAIVDGALRPIRPVGEDASTAGRAAPSNILVVDDTASNRDLLSRRLLRDGHRVVEAENGRAALARAAGEAFDLVLLDLMMPGMGGFEVLCRLKADPRTRDVPVIVVSALDEIDSAVRCIEAGAEDYLQKPFNAVLLRARIGASLEKKRLRDRERAFAAELRAEKERSEALLLNILPHTIVARMRDGETTIADRFLDATILFCDLVDFTSLAAHMPPNRTVELLGAVFSGFDRLAASHGLEKIKTIGDAYMVAGGLPEARADHAAAAADMALGMLGVVREAGSSFGERLEARIGLHTGPAVAGIIGTHKFAYDVWGDTVNTASRMETYGVPGRIQVSAATRLALAESFRLEPRGPIAVKGKGMMETYFLLGRRG